MIFVKEDCTDLPLPQLIRKIQNALATKDTAALWLYARYGKIRVANPSETERGQIKARETLKTLVDSVSERFLDRRGEPVNKQARELMQEIKELTRRVHDRKKAALIANPSAAGTRYQQM